MTALKMITLDCPDPRVSGTFWSELLGWDVAALEDEYAMLSGPAGMAIGLGVVPDFDSLEQYRVG